MTSELPLPPLPAIRAFEAAARHGNFTAAGVELGLTQAAVSYQIKQLEDRVGVPLFQRRARGVVLTEEGAALAHRAGEALDMLRSAFAEARRAGQGTLVLSALPTFAMTILAPRLGRFQITHPDVALRVDVDNRIVDLVAGQATVAIRSGPGEWPGIVAHRLFRPHYTVFVSPPFVERHGLPQTPEAMLDLPRIDPGDEAWGRWFEAGGITPPALPPGRQVTLQSQVLMLPVARSGEGAALLSPVFFRDHIDNGDLIQPFDISVPDRHALYLVYAEHKRNNPAVRAFRDWFLADIAAVAAAAGA
jgi:LysR family transcriptional regulator, glycine cleavage system transcriptional activator